MGYSDPFGINIAGEGANSNHGFCKMLNRREIEANIFVNEKGLFGFRGADVPARNVV